MALGGLFRVESVSKPPVSLLRVSSSRPLGPPFPALFSILSPLSLSHEFSSSQAIHVRAQAAAVDGAQPAAERRSCTAKSQSQRSQRKSNSLLQTDERPPRTFSMGARWQGRRPLRTTSTGLQLLNNVNCRQLP